jgi:branched-chain amino acid aminotransferase
VATKVWLSTHGRVLDPEHATISVFDRGFLYGDSVYETLRTVGANVLELEPHLRRLRRSAVGIAFELPFSDADIADAIAQTLAAAGNPKSRIRVIVTRGTGPIMLDTRVAESPVLVVLVTPLEDLNPAERLRGLSAVVVGRHDIFRSGLVGLKTGNYLGNILALHQAHDQGADDAILCNADGEVAEGSTSNLFLVIEGRVHTPSLASGLLAGITRDLVIRLLETRLGLQTVERTVLVDELTRADELFLTSSIRGVMPVTKLDGVAVGDGTAGPLTRRVIDVYEAFLSEQAQPLAPRETDV